MASRYWVGGTATWDNTAGSKWALTSGGAGGQAVPTASDNVFFDANSGTVVVTMQGVGITNFCLNFDSTGFTGSFNVSGNGGLDISGSLTLGSTQTGGFNVGNIFFLSTATGNTITTNGNSITTATSGITFNGVGGGWTFQDNITCDGITLTNGSLNTNGVTVTINNANGLPFISSNSNVRTLTLGGSTIILATSATTPWSLSTITNLTFNAGTSTIKFTYTGNSQQKFNSGALTYNNLWFSRGSSTGENTLIVTGSTFNNIKDDGTGTHSLAFRSGQTQTLNTFTVSGTSGHLISITSCDGVGDDNTSTHTLSIASGIISSDYLNIQHSVATGGATFYAGANSVNNQGVATAGSGWIFTAPPSPANASFLLTML